VHQNSAGPRLPRRRAAGPNTNDEKKEATTMAKQKAAKGESAKQVAIDVLRAADEPLHAQEIAKRVIDSGRCSGLKGKTPEATISSMLAVGSKAGGPFSRVGKGTYTLAATAAGMTEQVKPAAAKPARTRKAAASEAKAGKNSGRARASRRPAAKRPR
jgi:hypothetical protein